MYKHTQIIKRYEDAYLASCNNLNASEDLKESIKSELATIERLKLSVERKTRQKQIELEQYDVNISIVKQLASQYQHAKKCIATYIQIESLKEEIKKKESNIKFFESLT